MRSKLIGTLVAIVLTPGGLLALPPGPTPTPGTLRPLPSLPGAKTKLFSDAAVARLKAAGLEPGDPQLTQKLKTKLLQSPGRGGKKAGLSKQPAGRPAGGRGFTLPSGLAKGRTSPSSGPSSLTIDQFSLDAWYMAGLLKVRSAKFLYPSDISYRLQEPTCGVDVTGTLEGKGSFVCCGVDADGAEWMNVEDYISSPLVFGGKPRSVTMTLTANGLPAATKVFPSVWGRGQSVTITMTIDAQPPHLPANDFGIGAANAKFGGSGPRASTGEPWAPTSGEDTIGLGVNLGAGYQVTETKITSVVSQLDPPGANVPENAYRYARIKTKPDGGRLQTVVEWMYGPAESLTYTIEWKLSGPMGQRPLSTMPSAGPCDVN